MIRLSIPRPGRVGTEVRARAGNGARSADGPRCALVCRLSRLARVPRRALILLVCGLALAGCSPGSTTTPTPQTVIGKVAVPPTVEGRPGRRQDRSSRASGCTSCHTLKDAGAKGTVGPNLDQKKPPAALVVERVTSGKGVMPSFSGQLTPKQIADVAAYVSSVAGS